DSAAHGCIDADLAALREALCEELGRARPAGRQVHNDPRTAAGGDPAYAEDHRPDDVGRRQADEHDVGAGCEIGWRRRGPRTVADSRLKGALVRVEDAHLIAGLDEPAAHGAAHAAETNESKHLCRHPTLSLQRAPSRRTAVGRPRCRENYETAFGRVAERSAS